MFAVFSGTEALGVLPAWGLLSALPTDVLTGPVSDSAPSRLTLQSNEMDSGGWGGDRARPLVWGGGRWTPLRVHHLSR